jgi:coenzyme F420-reducing hydrogenase delta subunit
MAPPPREDKAGELVVLACSRALEAEKVPPKGQPFAGCRLVRLPCSSKAEPDLVLSAFRSGAVAVAVIPCAQGACQYQEGNRRARALSRGAAVLLGELGLEENRLAVYPLEMEERTGIEAFLAGFRAGLARPADGRGK